MLDVFWFCALILTALSCSFAEGYFDQEGRSSGAYFAWGFASVLIALTFSWKTNLLPLFMWLMSILPQQGELINAFTALVITGIVGLVVLVAILFLPYALAERVKRTDRDSIRTIAD